MKEYLDLFIKPFDFTKVKVDISAIMAVLVSIGTFITGIAENYLGISGTFFGMLAILITADFFTGVTAVILSKGIKGLNSKRGLKVVWKSGAYMLFLYVIHSLHQEVQGRAEVFELILRYFHIFLISHICFWELFSVDENLKKMGLDIGITEFLKTAYESIKNIFTQVGKNKIRNPESEILDDEEKSRIRSYDEQ